MDMGRRTSWRPTTPQRDAPKTDASNSCPCSKHLDGDMRTAAATHVAAAVFEKALSEKRGGFLHDPSMVPAIGSYHYCGGGGSAGGATGVAACAHWRGLHGRIRGWRADRRTADGCEQCFMFGDWRSGAEPNRRLALAFEQPVNNLCGRRDVCEQRPPSAPERDQSVTGLCIAACQRYS